MKTGGAGAPELDRHVTPAGSDKVFTLQTFCLRM